MSILHYFGLKNEFKGIFNKKSIPDSIDALETNYQDFDKILEYLKFNGQELQSYHHQEHPLSVHSKSPIKDLNVIF